MKTIEKTFDAVEYMNKQSEKLSQKLNILTNKEILEYFKQIKLNSKTKPSA